MRSDVIGDDMWVTSHRFLKNFPRHSRLQLRESRLGIPGRPLAPDRREIKSRRDAALDNVQVHPQRERFLGKSGCETSADGKFASGIGRDGDGGTATCSCCA